MLFSIRSRSLLVCDLTNQQTSTSVLGFDARLLGTLAKNQYLKNNGQTLRYPVFF